MSIKIAEYKFDNTLYDLFPEFNEGFTYTYEDVVEENITTRTIYSDSLPTMVKFGGNVTAYNLNPNKFDSLLNILYVNTSNIDDMSYMFGRCKSLQTVCSSDWGTSNVTNMNSMFCDCRKLTSLDASNWDTNTVTDMGSMFYNCQALTSVGDISNWNTSKVTTMYGMFQGCSSLTSLDVSNFDTSKVTTMNTMFWGCRKLTSLDVSNWDTNTVTDMYGLFQGCQSLTSLNASNWNTGNVTNMYMMFYYCKSLTSLDLTNFDTSKVTNMSDMLNFCPLLNSILMSNSDHDSVNKIIAQLPTRTEDSMGTLNIAGIDDISQVNTTTAQSKFWNIDDKFLVAEYKFNNTVYDLFPEFNEGFEYTYEDVVEEGVTTRAIYSNSLPTLIRFGHHEGEVSNRELSLLEVININTSCITTMNTMFCVCKNVTRIKLGNTKNVNDMYAAFYHCDKLVEVIADTWNTSNVTDMSYMLSYCGSLTTLDVSEWDTSKVTNMDSLFYECSKLTSIDVSKWNTENVENMRQLFDFCKLLNSLDVSKWNTSKATSMRYMFGYCESLTELDVSNFDTGQVTDMLCTFTNCKLLTKIDVDNWDMRNVLDISSMFSKCTSLTELNVNNWDVSNIKNMNHVFTGLLLENIDISNWRPISAIEIDGMFWDCSNLKEIDLTNFTPSDEATSLALMFSNTGITSLDSILGLSKLINYMKPTEVYNMFSDCKALTSVDISDWDTRNFSSLQNMFAGCSSLSSVKLNINTSNITNLSAMFYDCSSLTTLNLSNFNTSKVNNIRMMFSLCTSLTTLNISNWDLNAVTNILYLFYDCNNLNAITMKNSDYASVNKVIEQLPTRTADNPGTLDITGVDDYSQVDLTTAKSKHWNVRFLVARYTANASGVVPTFNSGYVYDVIETVNEGIYTVELYAENDFSRCSFKDKLNLLTVDYLRVTNKVTNMQSMFNGCNKLTSIDTSNWDVSEVTTMRGTFFGCNLLAQLDVSNWDTGKVTSMYCMFIYCRKLTQLDVSKWDTSNVTDMSWMFDGCYLLTQLDVSNFDTSNVTVMNNAFNCCQSLTQLDLSKWDTNKVTTISMMFNYCSNLTQLDVSNFDTSKVTSMSRSFSLLPNLQKLNISNWVIIDSCNVSDIFGYEGVSEDLLCKNLNEVIMCNSDYNSVNKIIAQIPVRTEDNKGTLDITGVDDIAQVNIADAKAKNWNVKSNVVAKYTFNNTLYDLIPEFNEGFTDYTYEDIVEEGVTTRTIYSIDDSLPTMVKFGAPVFQATDSSSSLLSVDYINFTNIDNMFGMFKYCVNVTEINTSNWDTSKVTTMTQAFGNCQSLTTLDVSNFDTSNVKDMSFMFQNCRAPELDVSNFDTSNVTNIGGIFNGCINVSQLDVSKWDTSNVTNMSAGVFGSCRKVTELDLSNWNTGKVTVMNSVFSDCRELTTIGDVSKWDVSNVTNIISLFNGCSKLTSLNLSGWNTSKVTSMNSVFKNCSSIEKLNLSNWTLTDDGAVATDMFAGCTNLRELNISNLCKTIKPELLSLEANTAIRELNLFNWSNGNIEHLLINNQLPGNAATYNLRTRAVGDDERVVYSRYVSNENKNVLNELGWVVVVPKLVDTVGVKKIAKAVKDIAKAELDVEVLRATNAEADLQAQIDEIEINCDNKASKEELQEVEAMFGGKSFRYVLQEEYDNLSEEEKNDKSKTYFITDAVDLSHDHENKEFLDGLSQEVLDNKASKEELQEVETLLNNKSDIIEFNAGERIEKDFAGNINSNLDSQNVDVYGKINLVVDNDYIVYISIDITDNEGNVTTLNDKRIVSAETYNAEGSVLLNILDGKIMIIDNSIVNSKGQCIYYKNYLAIIYNELIQAYGNNIVVKKLDIFETDYRQINSELFSSGDYHLLTNAEKQTIGNVLTKDNTENYTPTEKYNPATKSYVDNSILNGRPLYDVSDVVEPIEYDCSDVLPITLSEGINYINIPNHLNITQGVEYNLECTKSDSSLFGIIVISSAIATYDENKDCLVLDFGGNTIIYVGVYYNEADGTFSKNENNHVYSDAPLAGYNRIKKIELTASDATPVCDEFLKVFKFVTEEEKDKWNNKANKEDMYYDTRELQEINITFDGDVTGKEVVGFYFSSSGSLSANGLVKITDEIYDNIQIVETITATSPTSIMYYYCEKDEIIVTDDYILAGTGYRYVVSVKNDGTYELNSGIKPVTLTRGTYIYYSNTNSLKYMSDVKLIINTNNGELSVIDEKYLINSPGRYQEGKVKTINTDEGIEKVVCGKCSEIFNSEFNIASGESSHAEGYNTKAIGVMSHAEGNGTGAYGNYSHSEGTATAAKGSSSHAEGSATQAIGAQSHAEGYRTIASADYQHVQGQCNIEDTEGKYAHIVGNGAYNKPSNAHTLDWEGNAWFAGNVSVGADNKQLATEEFVNKGIERLNQELYHDARIINNLEVIWDGQINDQEVTEEYTINNIQYTFVKIADFEIDDATMCNADMKIDINIFGNHSDSISNKSGVFVNNACVIKGDKYNIVIVKQDNTDVTMDDVTVNFSKGIWFTKCYDASHPYAKETFTRVSNLEIISGYVKLVDTIFTSNKPGLVTYDENGVALGEIFNSETNTATGECSHAEGWMCNAVGKYSHAEGIASRAEGYGSHAECRSTTAESATYGHAEGYGSKAVGEISHAEGYATEAHGKYSHSEGHNSISSGTSSHAEGESCKSNGSYSHAEGYYTIAGGNYQHVQGRLNVEDTESKYAHIIGNGTSDSKRSNAHTLDWNGNAWFAGNVSINGIPANDNDLVNKQYVDENQLGYDTREYTNINISYWNGQIGERENVVLGDYTFVKMDDLSNCPDNVNHCEYYGFCRLHTDGSAGMPILYNSMEDHSDINDYYLCKHDNGAYLCAIVIKDSVVLINDLSINLTKGLWFIQTINPNLEGTGIPEHILKTVNKTDLEEFKLTLITGELKLIDNIILGNKPGLVIRNEKGDALGEIFNDEDNIASEPFSHAEGCSTQATARGAHVEGFFTKASGLASHAEGYRTEAASQYQHVQGQYNIEDTENKYAHIVGNGDYNARSNAHTLDWNGNAWFQGNVSVNGTPTNDNDLVTKKYVDESIVQALSGLSITKITQAEYDALAIKDPNTLYIITQ